MAQTTKLKDSLTILQTARTASLGEPIAYRILDAAIRHQSGMIWNPETLRWVHAINCGDSCITGLGLFRPANYIESYIARWKAGGKQPLNAR
jgi:hypothetical protein